MGLFDWWPEFEEGEGVTSGMKGLSVLRRHRSTRAECGEKKTFWGRWLECEEATRSRTRQHEACESELRWAVLEVAEDGNGSWSGGAGVLRLGNSCRLL